MASVKQLNGDIYALADNLDRAVKALRRDGCLVVIGATDLSDFESLFKKRLEDGMQEVLAKKGKLGMSEKDGTIVCVRKDMVLNNELGRILFSDHDGDLVLGTYFPVVLFPNSEPLRVEADLYAFECIHLGGDPTTIFSIDVDTPDERTETLAASRGDIFVFKNDRRRTTPTIKSQRPAFIIRSFYIKIEQVETGLLGLQSGFLRERYVREGKGSVCVKTIKGEEYAIWSKGEFMKTQGS